MIGFDVNRVLGAAERLTPVAYSSRSTGASLRQVSCEREWLTVRVRNSAVTPVKPVPLRHHGR